MTNLIQNYKERFNTLSTNFERLNLIKELMSLSFKDKRVATGQFYSVRGKGISRQKLNDEAIDLIAEFDKDPNRKPTDAEKEILAKFSGFGGGLIDKTTGQKGSAYEYYTPKPIAEGIWDSLKNLGFNGGKVLDPSAGTGIFGATAPLNAAIDAVELSKLSGRVNQLVNDGTGYKTTISNFESVASKTPDETYDAIVTNVPFGDVSARGANRFDDGRYQDDPLENYFILRSIEKLKPRGLAAFIVPMRCVSGKGGKSEELRIKASYMAEFVGAYRLPSGTFSTASTDVATDVIFFRKYAPETAQKIAELREQNAGILFEALIQWDTFIEGKYFESSEGKPYVLGEFVAKDPTKFRDVDKVISNAGLNDLREILQKKRLPKSRINWELLETVETDPIIYNEGDVIHQAGCTLVMRNGTWVQLPKSAEDMDLATIAEHLSEPYKAFENKVGYLDAVKYFDGMEAKDQLMSVPDWLRETLSTLNSLPENSREKYWNKGIIGLSVSQVLDEHSGETGFNYHDMFTELSGALEKAKITKKDCTIGGNLGVAMRHAIQQYFKKQFSDFWLGNVSEEVLKTAEVVENIDTPEARLNRLAYNSKSLWLDIEAVKEIKGPDFDPIKDSEWCISPDGKKVISADDYYVGNYADFLAKIDNEIENAANATIKDKLLRQKMDAESRAGKVNISRYTFDLRTLDSIITPEEKVSFLKTYVSEYATLSQDELGRPYADIVVKKTVRTSWGEMLYNRVGDYIKNGTISIGGMKLPDDVDKEKALNELKTIINRANENINVWAKSNKEIMARLQAMAENPKNRRFKSVDDESEIRIPGMNPDLHLHGYQSAYVRQMGREFGGINGFGVGLGKTFTALAAVQHVQAMGVKNKTIFIVPNSVLANWRKEASHAYTSIEDCLFVGLRTDKKGKAKTNSSAYAEDLSKIKENKHSKIFMTFEAFKRIRLKDETIEKFGSFMRANDLSYATSEDKKKDEKNKGSLAALMSQFNNEKESAFPYLEDLGIDSIVIDEAHAFKNGSTAVEFKGGKYLSLTPASARGLDAQLKTWYIRGQSPLEDGVLMLTATPITNSPLEIFSMLSLAVGVKRVNQSMIGCQGADDFLDTTCKISQEVGVQVDGVQKSMNIFTGLKNVDVLRQAIGQAITVKEAKDVGAKVFIPERDVKSQKITLDEDSINILQNYKLAYRYATEYVKRERNKNFKKEFLEDPYKAAYKAISNKFGEPPEIIGHPFNLIQKMSRAILDKELDEKASFYTISESESALQLAGKVCDEFDELDLKEDRERKSPWTKDQAIVKTKTVKDTETGDLKTLLTIHVESDVVEGGAVQINNTTVGNSAGRSQVVIDSIDNKAQSAYEKLAEENNLGLDVTCSPKMAALLENFKNEMAHPRGMVSEEEKSSIVKQIIFCDELSLHNKIKRLLSSKCGIPSGKIAIITGQTNNEPEQLQDVSDGFNSQGEENRYQVIIANEKAEVGINLQKGTQAIHHLTIGWTPDSLEQRNGRGARQGNKTQRVTIYYYDAEGTFDEARREMVNKKSEWIGQVLDVQGQANVDIKGGLSTAEQEALIDAVGDTEGTRKVREKLEAKEKEARIQRTKEAQLNNIDMLVKQQAYLEKYKEVDTFLLENISTAYQMYLNAEALRSKYEYDKRKAEEKKQPLSDRTRERRNAAIESALGAYFKLCDKLDESATFFYKNEPCSNFDSFLSYYIERAYKPSVKGLLEDLTNEWEGRYRMEKKEQGGLIETWKTNIEQANSLVEQSIASFSEHSGKEGAFSPEILEKFKKGEGRVSGNSIVTVGTFYPSRGRLCVVTKVGNDELSVECLEENQTMQYWAAYSNLKFENASIPGSSNYEQFVKEAAQLEDNAAKAGYEGAPYSAVVPEVSQYRTTKNVARYYVNDDLLPQPYFPLVVDPDLAKQSEFFKSIVDKQKEVVIRASSYSYYAAADLEVEKRSLTYLQKLKLFADYAKAHGYKVPVSELKEAHLFDTYYLDRTLDADAFRKEMANPAEGMSAEEQANAWIKKQLDWVDWTAVEPTEFYNSGVFESIIEEAVKKREKPDETLDSHKVNPDSQVFISGNTKRWYTTIKFYASMTGDTARWIKSRGAWSVRGKTWNRLLDEKGSQIIEDLYVRVM